MRKRKPLKKPVFQARITPEAIEAFTPAAERLAKKMEAELDKQALAKLLKNDK